MERMDTIMEKMGFNKDAEDSVKAAFIKNLIKQAYGIQVEVPAAYQPKTPAAMTAVADVHSTPAQKLADNQPLPLMTASGQLVFNLDAETPTPERPAQNLKSS